MKSYFKQTKTHSAFESTNSVVEPHCETFTLIRVELCCAHTFALKNLSDRVDAIFTCGPGSKPSMVIVVGAA